MSTGNKPNSAALAPPHPDLALSHTLFSGLAAELARDPTLAGPLYALYNIRVLRRGVRKGDYYLLFQGDGARSPPVVSTTMPATAAMTVGRRRPRGSDAGSNFTGPVAAAATADTTKGSPKTTDDKLPVVMIEIDQRDLFNFFSGGLNTYRAITSGKIRVAGDLTVAMALEDVFRKAGGVEKTMQYLRKYQDANAGKAKL